MQVLADLRHRLELDLARLPPALEGAAFTYGFHATQLRLLGRHWLDRFDWRKEEARLNAAADHFTTRIDGLDVHFLHAKPTARAAAGKRVIPLLLVHGWPGEPEYVASSWGSVFAGLRVNVCAAVKEMPVRTLHLWPTLYTFAEICSDGTIDETLGSAHTCAAFALNSLQL